MCSRRARHMYLQAPITSSPWSSVMTSHVSALAAATTWHSRYVGEPRGCPRNAPLVCKSATMCHNVTDVLEKRRMCGMCAGSKASTKFIYCTLMDIRVFDSREAGLVHFCRIPPKVHSLSHVRCWARCEFGNGSFGLP